MTIAELTLLGGFRLRLAGGETIDLPGQKDRALLAFMALHPGGTHTREKLAGLLWSDRGDQQARDSLKHALTPLRQCLLAAASPLVADRQSVRLEPAALSVDVTLFEQLLREGTPEALERATTLYGGDLLDGIDVRDVSFEDWLAVERQRLRHLAEEALGRLMEQSMAAGARERAASAARRLLSLDPLREVACRTLMQIEADRGRTAQALKLFETLRERLHRDLDVRPEAATVRLQESIRRRRSSSPAPADSPLATEAVAPPEPAPADQPLPSKPSIAILAFQNLSGDPEQEYFADGIVEEIITALSRMPWLFVIARNSSFTYKGRAVDAKQIGRELGVRYILEGSVRKAGHRVRITGQLIDASLGAHLWAGRFEGELENIFDLQDQVTASVVGQIAPKLEAAEIERARRKPTDSLDAYDYYLRGMACVHRWTREANKEALHLFDRAIEIDPNFAAAYGMAARCYSQRKVSGWVADRPGEIAEAKKLARRAAELGKQDAVALCTAGIVLAYVAGELEEGDALIDRALQLNPNWAWAWLFSGWAKVWLGEPEIAIERVARAMRLSPQDPQFFNMQTAAAWEHFLAGQYAEAMSWSQTALREQPDYVSALRVLAASSALNDRLPHAREAMARVRQLDPDSRISTILDRDPLRRPEDLERFAEGLRRAGLPE